jgi:hypothetical protein
MRPAAASGILIALALALGVAVGCASSGSDLPAAQPPPDAGPPGTLTAELPAPSSLKLPQGVLSHVYHTGVDYVDAWPRQRVWSTDEGVAEYSADTVLDPFWMVTVVRRSYAIYSFDATGFTHGCTIKLNWLTTDGGGDCWVAMADFTNDSWRWYHPDPSGLAHFDPEACLNDGIAYALVLLTGTTLRRLESIHLGFELPPLISSVGPLSGEEGEEITLSALLNIPASLVTTWYWDLGSAGSIAISAAANPTLTLGSPGRYECSVKAWNAWGETEYPFVLTVDAAGADWRHAVIGTADSLDSPTSLALGFDSAMSPHIAYRYHGIQHAYLDDGFWRTETSVLSADDMTNSSLAIDSAGAAHLAYTHSVSPDYDDHHYVVHARKSGSAWQHNILDEYVRPYDLFAFNGEFFRPSLAVDASGNAGVSYVKRTYHYDMDDNLVPDDESLKYGGSPTTETLADVGPFGIRGHAVDMNAAGSPGVAFILDILGYPLRYAVRTGSDTWNNEFVEVTGSTGDIALEISSTDDQPRICYVCNVGPGNWIIRYARFDGVDWQVTAIGGTGDVSSHMSMALDSSGQPHICYKDKTLGELHYVFPSGLSWDVVTVDDDGNVGQSCDIAMDSSDGVHFSYYDSTHNCIKYAWQPAG